ncbi:cysteine--tRNA ligase-like isoform X2 [Brevipalpus obovatus]|uniref:cysteine--tRNA ligase-like isoform X2 n=1 Tax=Brevipalpus obovatus TaxID=246614 RepID=UPI003D9DE76F
MPMIVSVSSSMFTGDVDKVFSHMENSCFDFLSTKTCENMLRNVNSILRQECRQNLMCVYIVNSIHSSGKLCQLENDPSKFPLFLYNHYTHEKEPVKVDGQSVFIGNDLPDKVPAKSYICGPTVYDHCHIGHAMTYVRFDIFRRFMKNYSNTCLDANSTVMNITDIDEKIMKKSEETGTSYQEIEKKGYAYISDQTSDVNFDSQKVKNFGRGSETVTDKSFGKNSPKDFTLWRHSERKPLWTYESSCNGQKILGRPGWHVECSALASSLLGNKIDFHFGGKDLIYPHHYCESACCSIYFDLKNQELFQWASHWYHSSHILISKNKMSKSIGNTISIRDFLKKIDPDLLRLLCCFDHYRKDLNYNELIIKRVREIDRRLRKFLLSLHLALHETSNKVNIKARVESTDEQKSTLSLKIEQANAEILASIANDFNLRKALDSILALEKFFESFCLADFDHRELRELYKLVEKFVKSLGLNWISIYEKNHILELIIVLYKFREHVRKTAMHGLKANQSTRIPELNEDLLNQSEILLEKLTVLENKECSDDEFFILLLKKLKTLALEIKKATASGLEPRLNDDSRGPRNIFVDILNHCDALRNDLREIGVVIGDTKS